MSKACPQCSRTNPADASFCFFDGVRLPGAAQSGPLQAGTAPFAFPYVFANGDACTNFNQLAMGCQRNWDSARDSLKQGDMRKFLKLIGRTDLAKIAQQCTEKLDPNQALDQLLERFPVDVLEPAKLAVEPTQVNLGQVRPTSNTKVDLLVSNLGMRLLVGTVSTDCEWLALGEGQKRRMFQTVGERAGAKPLVGQLMVESNGGLQTIKIELSVPILPFPRDILQGAVTPRDLALKAKQFPKEAALLFEQGAVSEWYRNNGWTYPVEGPSGSGLGAVQQFFEALGLTKPPRVQISDERFAYKGMTGDVIAGRLKVTTPDKRPVFAHAWCDQPWLKFAEPMFQGTTVRLPFEVVIPPKPGETLRGKITVRANGNQRFQVPVTLAVDNVVVARVAPATMPEIVFAQEVPALELDPGEPFADLVPSAEDGQLIARDPGKPFTGLGPSSPDGRIIARDDRKVKTKHFPESGAETSGTFGMARLVYWSSLVGGWSAFAGWLIAEFSVGWWVGGSMWSLIAMIVLVASALGAGLSQVEGLLTGQWKNQLKNLGPGLLGGFVGGLLGGLLGHVLYASLHEISFLGYLARVLGWTVLGLFIGICQGILHGFLEGDWRKFRNGLIGGGLGGLLGGLFFDPVSWLIGSPVSSRAFAFVVLGLCIGLFLSLVQILLKEAWLTVEEGFRPGRQLIMDRAVITMGTSEKANLIFIAYGAKGVEPVHLRIKRKKTGEYVLNDNDSRGGTLLNGETIDRPRVLENGDVIQLGINKVRFQERTRRRSATD
jgi:FHA domain